MPFMRPESTALTVMDRIDALAAALRSAGVPAEQSSGLLAAAATAAMHAVTLDAVLAESQAVRPTQRELGAARPVRLAA
jgi:hypothetical protein